MKDTIKLILVGSLICLGGAFMETAIGLKAWHMPEMLFFPGLLMVCYAICWWLGKPLF